MVHSYFPLTYFYPLLFMNWKSEMCGAWNFDAPRGPPRRTRQPASPRPVNNFSKHTPPPPRPVHSAPRPARSRLGRLSVWPRPSRRICDGSRPAPPPWTRKILFLPFDVILSDLFYITNQLIAKKSDEETILGAKKLLSSNFVHKWVMYRLVNV
jgi:hypothetical protein